MPRDSSGNYTLPAGNPVITGSIIASSWANNTLNDLATEMTDSLSRSGKGGMNAAFKVQDGTVSLPGLAFTSEPGSGMYRIGAADYGFSVTGSLNLEFLVGGLSFHQPLTAPSGNSITITGVGTSTTPDMLHNANAVNFIADRWAGATGHPVILSIKDGNTGTQEWQIRAGSASTGTLDIYDATGAKSIIQIAPTTDNITFNAPLFINGLAGLYSETITGNSTSGQSYGMFIKAGTTSADFALTVANQGNTAQYFEVRGDGIVFLTDAAASSPALYKAGFRGSPPNTQSGAYTLVVSDAGKSVVFTAAATLTLPQSIFSEGDMTVVVAQGGVVTIAAGTGVTLTWANASNTTGSRTLTNIGIATIWWFSATQAYITGSGLT